MKEFKFNVTVTEIYTADLWIEAEDEAEAKMLIREREFDWNDDMKYGDCMDTSIVIENTESVKEV